MPERKFSAVAKLIEEVQRAAVANGPDCIAMLVTAIRAVIASEVDAYVLTAVLTEGIATTITTRVPKEKQAEVAGATMRLLYDRLKAGGALGIG